jgi:hypothetical protein
MNPEQTKRIVRKGSICQVDMKSERFPGCLVIVEEIRVWGVRCYIPYVDGTTIPLRISWDDIFYIGEARFINDQAT